MAAVAAAAAEEEDENSIRSDSPQCGSPVPSSPAYSLPEYVVGNQLSEPHSEIPEDENVYYAPDSPEGNSTDDESVSLEEPVAKRHKPDDGKSPEPTEDNIDGDHFPNPPTPGTQQRSPSPFPEFDLNEDERSASRIFNPEYDYRPKTPGAPRSDDDSNLSNEFRSASNLQLKNSDENRLSAVSPSPAAEEPAPDSEKLSHPSSHNSPARATNREKTFLSLVSRLTSGSCFNHSRTSSTLPLLENDQTEEAEASKHRSFSPDVSNGQSADKPCDSEDFPENSENDVENQLAENPPDGSPRAASEDSEEEEDEEGDDDGEDDDSDSSDSNSRTPPVDSDDDESRPKTPEPLFHPLLNIVSWDDEEISDIVEDFRWFTPDGKFPIQPEDYTLFFKCANIEESYDSPREISSYKTTQLDRQRDILASVKATFFREKWFKNLKPDSFHIFTPNDFKKRLFSISTATPSCPRFYRAADGGLCDVIAVSSYRRAAIVKNGVLSKTKDQELSIVDLGAVTLPHATYAFTKLV